MTAEHVKASWASRKSTRWALGVAGAVMCAIGLVLLFLLMQATNNRELYERHYAWLFGLNVLVAVALSLVLLWMMVRLAVRWRQRKFGSRLLLKLAAIFGLVGVIPGLLIYVVSYQFVSRSIESWFDVKVEGALSAGVNLASVTLETIANDMANNTRTAGQQLAQVSDATAGIVLERIREQLGATDVVLWNDAGVAVATAGISKFELAPTRPSGQELRSLRAGLRPVATIEGLDEAALAPPGERIHDVYVKTLVLVSNPRLSFRTEQRFLQAAIPMPSVLVVNALAVQDANREYQERALARDGLQRMYIGTLTLSLFLAVFGAVLLAVLLGNQLARPLLVLAQGVRDVARGDLTPKIALQSKDELGGLTRSFAMMTQQLLDARIAVDKSMGEVKAARTNLQTILDNLTAGVLVLDDQWHVLSINPGATRILRTPMAVYIGRALHDIPGLAGMASMVEEQFNIFLGEQGPDAGRDRWQQVLELTLDHAVQADGEVAQDKTTLVVRGAELPQSRRLIVFDDISEIVSAQRSKAWAEVARRVAHEIKNPLTPIQLSAERLSLKLTDKLEPTDQALLARSVKTIVDQVAAMLRLVNEFRDYARLPAANLQPLDLNALILDLVQLYGEENAQVRVQTKLDQHVPWIAGDAQQLRQVIHNLVQNAQDATLQHAQSLGVTPPAVEIAVQWIESSKRVRLSISDSGIGFAPHILQRAFEPYVTTKVGGTGLGLAVVKKIADEHGARIDLANRMDNGIVQGAQVSLSFVPVSTEAP